ncbi:leader peptidase (prepilin peptidase) / N-methyltransferase [Friedmanniella luteola]|uniref:Leader peptidase (Prepilin peptidase) / N-methyltransferase n=1 Tax=Friedmanniella luteola TaxID=546871 RepID=A0A1H1P5G1_9ACTN|nr:prepilin peptidase [Friedmanniella luteola]SDS05839.1 leader peptidase (prepilin peptidase) / N-methyltransferase [Friedmanniella luteola]
MTPAQLLVPLAVLVTGLVTAAVAGPLLRRLPEPTAEDPPGYAELPTPRFLLAVGLGSASAAAVAWTALPATVQPLWTVLAVGGVLLAGVDLATTWLPLRLVQLTWAAMAVAALTGAALGGGWAQLVRSAVGAAVAGALYLLVWTASRGGFGFGDVRYAPLLGAAAAAHGWRLLLLALLTGTLVGGVVGLVQLVRRRRGGFAYAPSMLLGAYLAVLTRWTG